MKTFARIFSRIAGVVLLVTASAVASDLWKLKTVEKRSVENTAILLDGEFATPRILDSVYIFVPNTLTNGTFTNYCTMGHSRSTNGLATNAVSFATTIITAATSSQSVHAVYIKDLDLKVIEGDVLYISNTMARTTVRLFFK